MIASDTGSTSAVAANASTVAVFQQDWKLYRKMVENNFLFHREAYGQLHRVLNDDMARLSASWTLPAAMPAPVRAR